MPPFTNTDVAIFLWGSVNSCSTYALPFGQAAPSTEQIRLLPSSSLQSAPLSHPLGQMIHVYYSQHSALTSSRPMDTSLSALTVSSIISAGIAFFIFFDATNTPSCLTSMRHSFKGLFTPQGQLKIPGAAQPLGNGMVNMAVRSYFYGTGGQTSILHKFRS